MREKLKHIFQNNFPGVSKFIQEVIEPIFAQDSITSIDLDIIDTPEKRRRADNANILSAQYVADIVRADSDPIAIYDVTLKPNSIIAHSRVAIKQFITADVMSYTHVFILFHYAEEENRPWRFSYVYKEASTAATRVVAKRYTYVFGKEYRSRTAIDRFIELAYSPKSDDDFAKAFSVEALSDEFFDRYRNLYADFVEYITGKRYVKEGGKWVEKSQHDPHSLYFSSFDEDDKLVRDYIKKMFGRIVFLYFLQRKGWLASNKNYMHDLFYKSDKQDDFLDGVLEPLFFEVLNEKPQYRTSLAKELPGCDKIPYLNGGLFAQDEIDKLDCKFLASDFKRLFDFFDQYNFTINENDPEDAEVGIDPEMLGRIFENLLEDNKDKGAFYTPKEIVEYMCRESIIAYLLNGIPERSHELIRNFVETLDADSLNNEQRKYLAKKLVDVKICDPAIGSGAFPMGIVNILSKIYIALGLVRDRSKMKRHIMEQNIYGVDIEKGAVDIARLRFWLAMIVEEKEPEPLPNLHFKIMHGNSLLESYQGVDLSDMTKVKPTTRNLFDSDDSERETLVADLKKYYVTSDHAERDCLFNEILKNVRRQLFAKDITLPQGMDPSANTEFFLWHTWFAEVFEKGGFDIVIGNPPYLKEGRASKSIFESVKSSPYYQGKMDLWYIFACNGIDMLKDGGNLCFIATNNWTTSAGAKKLRNKVITDTQILQICDFKDYMIFESASIQTMIMQFKKNSIINNYTFDLRNLLGTEFGDVNSLLRKELTPNAEYLEPVINREVLFNQYLTFSATDSLLEKIRDNKIFLSSDEVANGIHPHYDFINKKLSDKYGFPIGTGIFGLSLDEVNSLCLDENEKKFIKPYVNSCDLVHRYLTEDTTKLRIIYTTSDFKNPRSMDKYPHLKQHLDSFSHVISSDNKPYGLHRARKEKFFIGEKIAALRKCADRPIFSYSDFDCYLSATFYCIKTNKLNLKALTCILNSKLIEFWLRNKGKMQGSNFQLDAEPLQQIPISIPSEVYQNSLVKIYNRISSVLSKNTQANVSTLEILIDNIVYHLYNLEYTEVLMVDPETSITREEYENFNIEDVCLD